MPIGPIGALGASSRCRFTRWLSCKARARGARARVRDERLRDARALWSVGEGARWSVGEGARWSVEEALVVAVRPVRVRERERLNYLSTP